MARLDTTTPVIIGVNPARKSQIEKRAGEACEVINSKCFAILKELDLPAEQESKKLVEFLKDYRNFESYLSAKIRKRELVNEVTNRALQNILMDEINARIDAVMYDKHWHPITAYADELCVIDGVCTPNNAVIESKATYTLTTPDEIRAYHRHKKALEALNEFSGGKVSRLEDFFTILPSGEVVMRTLANFGVFNEVGSF